MKMKDWTVTISGLEYLLQFKTQPRDFVEKMCDAILRQRGISIPATDVLSALAEVRKSNLDISKLIPQPHSDATLRDSFAELEVKLTKAVSKTT
jgi:hypothetical protein